MNKAFCETSPLTFWKTIKFQILRKFGSYSNEKPAKIYIETPNIWCKILVKLDSSKGFGAIMVVCSRAIKSIKIIVVAARERRGPMCQTRIKIKSGGFKCCISSDCSSREDEMEGVIIIALSW